MYDQIVKIANSFTDECRANKLKGGSALLELAGAEAKDPNNYRNRFSAQENYDITREIGDIRQNQKIGE